MTEARIALLLVLLISAAVADLRTRTIPDLITLGGTVVLVAMAFAGGVAAGVLSVASAAMAFGVFLGVRALTRGKLGGGDAKLSMLLGAGLGPVGWYVALCVSVAAALVYALVARKTRSAIVFGPFLAVGGGAGLLVLALVPAIPFTPFQNEVIECAACASPCFFSPASWPHPVLAPRP